MTTRRFVTTGGLALALAALATTSLGASAASSTPAEIGAPARASGSDMVAATKIFKYDIAASYVLTTELVDATTSLRRVDEWRIDWKAPVTSEIAVYDDGSFRAPSGYSSGTVRISARDERTSPPCERTVEEARAIDVAFRMAKSGSLVQLKRMTNTPRNQCPPATLDALRIQAGALTATEASENGVTVRSTGALDPAFMAQVAAGRTAETTIALQPTTTRAGVTQRATVTLEFTRKTDGQQPTGKQLVFSKPTIVGISRYNASVGFAVTRGGAATGVKSATCTGSFKGGPSLFGKPYATLGTGTVNAKTLAYFPELKAMIGKPVTIVTCSFEHDEYTKACGKTFRGAVTVRDDRAKSTKRTFAFKWIDPRYQKGKCY